MRSLHLLPLIALALATSACGGTKNRGVESVHQPVVSRTDYVYDVASAGGLTNDDRVKLDGWFQSLKLGFGDRVSVDDPTGDRSVRGDVAQIAANYGVLIEQGAPITPGEFPPGTVRVVVSRSKAEVPGCPDWSRASQPEFNSHTTSNYGCGMNSTLAAMVANPEDLIEGRQGLLPTNSEASSKAIGAYRNSVPTGTRGLKSETTKGGN